MTQKIRFGLRKVHRAKVTRDNNGEVTFGPLKSVPYAQSLTMTPQGSDSQTIYADDAACYVVDPTNGGYTASMQFTRISAEERKELLGEIVDEETGVQYEVADAQAGEYAWVFETQGDKGPTAFVFYNGKAKRPNLEARTKGENLEIDADTLEIKFVSVELPFHGEKQNFIKGFLDKTEDNAAAYAAFFQNVVVPIAEAPTSE